jgi:hypothetical protein
VAILLPRKASNNGTWALTAASAKLDAELRERLTPDCVVAKSYAAATSSEARFDRTERWRYMSVNPVEFREWAMRSIRRSLDS